MGEADMSSQRRDVLAAGHRYGKSAPPRRDFRAWLQRVGTWVRSWLWSPCGERHAYTGDALAHRVAGTGSVAIPGVAKVHDNPRSCGRAPGARACHGWITGDSWFHAAASDSTSTYPVRDGGLRATPTRRPMPQPPCANLQILHGACDLTHIRFWIDLNPLGAN